MRIGLINNDVLDSGAMVAETIRSVFGSEPSGIEYECDECDATFRSRNEPDSFWLECTECGSDDVTPAART
ncbi:MAG: hypothetical protein ABEI11_00635 [Haloarculaceae archaeon]